jgi:hypothetical protein
MSNQRNKEFERGRKDGHKAAKYDREGNVITDITDAIFGHPHYKPGKEASDSYNKGYKQGKQEGKK